MFRLTVASENVAFRKKYRTKKKRTVIRHTCIFKKWLCYRGDYGSVLSEFSNVVEHERLKLNHFSQINFTEIIASKGTIFYPIFLWDQLKGTCVWNPGCDIRGLTKLVQKKTLMYEDPHTATAVVFKFKWWQMALALVVKEGIKQIHIFFSILSFENIFTGIKCIKPLVGWDIFLKKWSSLCVF